MLPIFHFWEGMQQRSAATQENDNEKQQDENSDEYHEDNIGKALHRRALHRAN